VVTEQVYKKDFLPSTVSGRVRPWSSVSDRVRPCPTVSDRVRPCPTVSDRVRPCSSVFVRVRPCPTVSDRVRPCPTVFDRVRVCVCSSFLLLVKNAQSFQYKSFHFHIYIFFVSHRRPVQPQSESTGIPKS
jgi:hypothetical protein